MNPVTNALKDLRYTVPIEILEATFLSRLRHRTHVPVSLDSRIRDLVISGRVLKDCNLSGGEEVVIDISGAPVQYIDTYSAVYTIPKSLTQGRTVTRALSISYGPSVQGGSNYAGMNQGSAYTSAAGAVMQSNAPLPMIATASVNVVGENMVMIADVNILPMNVFLRCWLENDSELATLQATAYTSFSKMVEYAVKSYIYLTMQIPQDIGEIHGGALLGKMKDIIDGYSDAEANYITFRDEKWRKIKQLDSFAFRKRHVTIISGMVSR